MTTTNSHAAILIFLLSILFSVSSSSVLRSIEVKRALLEKREPQCNFFYGQPDAAYCWELVPYIKNNHNLGPEVPNEQVYFYPSEPITWESESCTIMMTFNVHGMSARLGDYETWNNIRRITTEIINSCVANRLDATGGKQVLGNHGNLYMVVYDPRIPDATAREAGLNLSNDREKFNNPISYCRVRREQTTAEMFHLIEGVDESNVKKRSCDECIAQPIKNAQVLFGSGSNLFTDVGSCLPPW